MPKQLTTQNASITTATVEVKTLAVSGKQITLAVFRQLREVPLIAHDGSLNGTPWGYVNYHPDKCEPSHWRHHHIVWQRGKDLLRARVDHLPDFAPNSRQQAVNSETGTEEFVCDEIDDVVGWQTLLWLDGQIEDCPLRKKNSYGPPEYYADMSVKSRYGFRLPVLVSDTTVRAAEARGKAIKASEDLVAARAGKAPTYITDVAEYERQAAAADEAAAAALQQLRDEVEAYGPVAWEGAQRLMAQEDERRKRHYEVRKELGALPQLFIAV